MNRHLLAACVLCVVVGCAEERAATPPSVTAEFHRLLDGVTDTAPEASIAPLRSFLGEYGHYTIGDSVGFEIDRLRAAAQGRYHEARELARQGAFTEAERILDDLAAHVADTPDGESAAQHLAFDFGIGKAQWLLIRQRYEEAEAAARSLLDRDLTVSQNNQVETILDHAATVGAALSQSERAQAMSACRHVAIALATVYVEEGRYPTTFTLQEAERWGSIHGLSAIEAYRGSADSFSFEAVSANGRHRIRVVDGEIQH